MKKESNNLFVVIIVISSLWLGLIFLENVRSVLRPPSAEISIDVAQVKAALDRAGLMPREAKYWKEVR